MHGTQSHFNNDIEAVRAGKLPWYELMQRPGLVLKRPNPTVDSGGYRAIFVFDLAERLYKLPGLKQRVLGNDDNERQYFDRTKEFPLIRDGSIDVFVTYITNPLVEGLPFLDLPEEIDSEQPIDAELVYNHKLHQSAWTDVPRHLRRLCRNDTRSGGEPKRSRGFRPLASV
jgi:molybdate/tungstate transport system substrate-binding protein